ncbi:MAG: ornithine cyclodeaminase family protein [Acidobacteriota bacterium]|jgi:ornithine cyclodeaminase
MTAIIELDRIRTALRNIDVVRDIEAGFVAYSRGEVVVPPVGEMLFDDPRGEAHIKYGFIKGDDWFVIKVASGFYDNFKLGLPTNSGLMLLFSQKTGVLDAVLLDEGILTAERTAAAGAVVARHMAPKNVRRIGMLGTGDQARRQLRYLAPIIGCREVLLWGRSDDKIAACRHDVEEAGFSVESTKDAAELGSADLIVTVTAATEPLLTGDDIGPGTHITAVGSDTAEKQELDVGILARADVVVADSLEQCRSRGEIFQAVKAGAIGPDQPVELGSMIAGQVPGRTSEEQITVADLTGVAVQDIQISKAVYRALT